MINRAATVLGTPLRRKLSTALDRMMEKSSASTSGMNTSRAKYRTAPTARAARTVSAPHDRPARAATRFVVIAVSPYNFEWNPFKSPVLKSNGHA